jgi:hypothetical protein
MTMCPYCRDRNGKPGFHTHAPAASQAPWHRIAHCADVDLPWRLPERRRDGSLSYELVEASEPRVIKGPPLAMS